MLKALVEAVTRYTDAQDGESPYTTAIKGLILLRSEHEKRPNLLLYQPAICATLQGIKWTSFGDCHFELFPGQALIIGINAPAVGRVAQASPEEPYLGLVIALDMTILREVLDEIETPLLASDGETRGVLRVDFEGALADCALRMVRLLDTPSAVPMLAPSIMREIAYWLLTGPAGAEIVRLAHLTGPTLRIVEAIHFLRERYSESVRVEELAEVACMSPSNFHARFKSLTATTPLQYQKAIRLHEARRLLITTETNVETVAAKVGYESVSQFSREYSRTFGAPPRRDAAFRKLEHAV